MPEIQKSPWGESPKGSVYLYTLTNAHGNTISITDYGATITSIKIDGAQMVLGYDELAGYLGDQPYFGATIGRYGNRIANGRFSLDGNHYQLPVNNGPNCLHGGTDGFDKRVWSAREVNQGGMTNNLRMELVSPDGDQGFPGEVVVIVFFRWTDDNSLHIEYQARTDKPTILNLTNHAYFNIGDGADVLGQTLELKSDHFVPIDEHAIPLGHLAEVAGTPFDFRTPKPIGQDIAADHPQIKIAGGFDHTWVLPEGRSCSLTAPIATVTDPATGRKLHCGTSEPGVQVFTANFTAGQFSGRDHTPLPPHSAICLETQHFPDSPNQETFPSTLLRPGEVFISHTDYRFE